MTTNKVIETLRERLPERLIKKAGYLKLIDEKYPESNFAIFKNLAHVHLAMDDIIHAYNYYREALKAISIPGTTLLNAIPSQVGSPSLDLPWLLYLGLPQKQNNEHFNLIISETERNKSNQLETISIESYLTIISLIIILYLNHEYVKLNNYLDRISNETKKYHNVRVEDITSKDHKIRIALYTYAIGKSLKGLITEKKEDVINGMTLFSSIMEKSLKRSDDPEAIAEYYLIVIYDQAKLIWPDLYIDTPLIPESILEKGYWKQIYEMDPTLDCTH